MKKIFVLLVLSFFCAAFAKELPTKERQKCLICKEQLYRAGENLIQMGCRKRHVFHEICVAAHAMDYAKEYHEDGMKCHSFCPHCRNYSYKQHMYRLIITPKHVYKEPLFPSYHKRFVYEIVRW